MWYVIQTVNGKEETVKAWIEGAVSKASYDECIIVYYEYKKKYLGKWHLEQRKMFPGYIFIVTDTPEALKPELRKVKEFTRLLGYDGEIVPVSEEEETFIKTLIQDDEVVDMSYGIQAGDRIEVKEGPLSGMEYLIKKVDRHKRKAYIEMEFLGETRTVEIGLEIVEKKQDG